MKKSEALRILGLSDGATDDEIKSAHRKQVIANHPDNFAQGSSENAAAEEKTKLINEARDVLLSRKWEPEYGRRPPYSGNPGSPYTQSGPNASWGQNNPYRNPYTQRPGSGSNGTPYDSWPFQEGQPGWTWVSWDSAGQPFNPFQARQAPQKTPEQLKAEAKEKLKRDTQLIGVKAGLVVILTFLFGEPFFALFTYVLITVLNSLWKRYSGCLAFLVVPLVIITMPIILFLTSGSGAANFFLLIFFALCMLVDVRDIWAQFKRYQAL